MNQIAEQIKQQISMSDLFEKYGFLVKRGGFILCPFHSEKTPSLKAYAGDSRWKCFGCGAGGTVIDFVMALYRIDYRQALVRLDNDFRLGLTRERVDSPQSDKLSAERAAQKREKEAWEQKYNDLLERFAIIDRFLINHAPTRETAGDFGALMGARDTLWYWLQEMESQVDRR